MASPNLSEIITTTLRDRSGETADNVSKGNPLLFMLKQNGGWETAEGRTIVQELEYAEGRFQWYAGYDILDISPSDVITAAEYPWAQAAGLVAANGLEIDVQNTGKAQIINLFKGRIGNAQRTMKNQITFGMYSDGTAFSGKIVGGLQLIVADNPATGTVGGINRANFAFWRNQFFRATTDGGVAMSATNIQVYMDEIFLRCTRGTDKPNIIIGDRNSYKFFWNSLQAIQRITDSSTSKQGAGFRSLDFTGVPVYYEDNTGIPDRHMYFLNSDYLKLRYAPKRNFTPLPQERAYNQDAFVQMVLWAGQLTTSNASLQGVLNNN
jgi:hypothetical protein